MKLSALGHERVMSPDTLWARAESSNMEQPGRPATAACLRGVLSGIVVGDGESPSLGEGPDGSTQSAQETHAGHAGSDHHEPTSLRGIAHRAKESKHHRFRNLYQEVSAELLMHCWQDLNKEAASGVDGLTAQTYATNLEGHIADLAERVKAKRYRAQLVRRVYIPKENGKERPLGIPALEDKLVQLACAKLLNAIYEQDFLDCSHGYRPGRSAKETVCDLTFGLQFGNYGYLVEADVQDFFGQIDHAWLLRMLALRVDDRAFLHLIRKWLKAGVLDTDGQVLHPGAGTPQGGIISPVLANLYLHHALDLWFERVVKPRCRGEALLCRYADDFVCAFRYHSDAWRFYQALPKRLAKFGLEVAPEKTQVLRFSRFHPSMKRRATFLGFELYWLEDRQGVPRVMRRTARRKLQGALQRIKDWIKSHRHLPGRDFIKGLNRRLVGHYNYYGLRGNSRDLWRFYQTASEWAFKWLNRRGGKRKSFTWQVFNRALQKLGIAKPRITERSLPHRVFA
jgi:RNA-directed DNA polymerase